MGVVIINAAPVHNWFNFKNWKNKTFWRRATTSGEHGLIGGRGWEYSVINAFSVQASPIVVN